MAHRTRRRLVKALARERARQWKIVSRFLSARFQEDLFRDARFPKLLFRGNPSESIFQHAGTVDNLLASPESPQDALELPDDGQQDRRD